eukprot:SAG11_NODE_10793_length_805_cov_1.123229_1_plen_175_part_10
MTHVCDIGESALPKLCIDHCMTHACTLRRTQPVNSAIGELCFTEIRASTHLPILRYSTRTKYLQTPGHTARGDGTHEPTGASFSASTTTVHEQQRHVNNNVSTKRSQVSLFDYDMSSSGYQPRRAPGFARPPPRPRSPAAVAAGATASQPRGRSRSPASAAADQPPAGRKRLTMA